MTLPIGVTILLSVWALIVLVLNSVYLYREYMEYHGSRLWPGMLYALSISFAGVFLTYVAEKVLNL